MKRFFVLIFLLIVLFAFTGCSSNKYDVSLQTGTYYMSGDFKEGLTPYVSLSREDMNISIGGGTYLSFAAVGTFKIDGESLLATTQVGTFAFEIEDSNVLIVVDGGDSEFIHIPENSRFVRFETTE